MPAFFSTLRCLWVKSTCHSFGGPEFYSQHPCGSLQPPAAPVAGDLKLPSDLHHHQVSMWYILIYMQAKCSYRPNRNKYNISLCLWLGVWLVASILCLDFLSVMDSNLELWGKINPVFPKLFFCWGSLLLHEKWYQTRRQWEAALKVKERAWNVGL